MNSAISNLIKSVLVVSFCFLCITWFWWITMDKNHKKALKEMMKGR